MSAGKVFAFLGGLLTLLGTYLFALYGVTGGVGSGIGFIMNIPDLFTDADTIAALLSTPVALYYVYLVIFIIFLGAGVLQMLSIESRAVGFIFSLFPLGVGLMFIFLAYTDFLGIKSAFFANVYAVIASSSQTPNFEFLPAVMTCLWWPASTSGLIRTDSTGGVVILSNRVSCDRESIVIVTFEFNKNSSSLLFTLVPVKRMRSEENPAVRARKTSPGLTVSRYAPSVFKIFSTDKLVFAFAE